MSDTTETILIEADKSAWPLLPSERNWGGWKLGISLATAAAATWCYIIGEYVGKLYLEAKSRPRYFIERIHRRTPDTFEPQMK